MWNGVLATLASQNIRLVAPHYVLVGINPGAWLEAAVYFKGEREEEEVLSFFKS